MIDINGTYRSSFRLRFYPIAAIRETSKRRSMLIVAPRYCQIRSGSLRLVSPNPKCGSRNTKPELVLRRGLRASRARLTMDMNPLEFHLF